MTWRSKYPSVLFSIVLLWDADYFVTNFLDPMGN